MLRISGSSSLMVRRDIENAWRESRGGEALVTNKREWASVAKKNGIGRAGFFQKG